MEICKRCKYAPTCSAASYSDFCLNYDPRPLTNADRIRAMTDEELAMLLQPICPTDALCPDELPHDCYKCWLDWLKQEVTT